MEEESRIRRVLIALLIISLVIRGFVAWFIELGYDEVYYWTYARFPDLSHFDHPPMVGWVIRLFSLDLLLPDGFFLRLGAVVFGTLNTWLIYRIGKTIRNPMTGLYAAFLYTGSFYAFVLCGIFILPDGPQSFFWLLTLWALLRSLPDPALSRESRLALLAAGLTTGLALLSKYHAAALISGTFFFILFHNRKWLAARETWIALLLALLTFMPVILWNYKNSFISFTFHESRILPEGKIFRPDFFITEFLGEIFYNNPVNFFIVAAALISLIFGRRFMDRRYLSLLLWISVPMVTLVILFSLFRQTLPHWSGPAWFGFILIGAAWLEDRGKQRGRRRLMPAAILCSLLFMLVILGAAVTQIRYGWIPASRWKVRDLTLDLYGWKQLGEKVTPVIVADIKEHRMPAGAPILTFRWFPAANYDFYLARTSGNPVYATGPLTSTHKYHWIDHLRGDLPAGTDAYYIALSDDFRPADQLYGGLFDTILPPDTLAITRRGETVRDVYLYRMKGLKNRLSFPATLK